MSISRAKLALLHVGKRARLELPEYRECLRHPSNIKSSKDLDEVGFKLVLDQREGKSS